MDLSQGKVWDTVHGHWVDAPAARQDETAKTCPTCKLGKGICRKKNRPGHLSSRLSAGGGTAAGGSAVPTAGNIPRPPGRARKGMIWDKVRGKWIPHKNPGGAGAIFLSLYLSLFHTH